MFRFTIRDVLWLIVVVGMDVGWWLEHREALLLRAEMAEMVRHLHWTPAGPGASAVNESP
jgi:hypothetical protein